MRLEEDQISMRFTSVTRSITPKEMMKRNFEQINCRSVTGQMAAEFVAFQVCTETIAKAFHRIIPVVRSSSSRSPGYGHSATRFTVLQYGVFGDGVNLRPRVRECASSRFINC